MPRLDSEKSPANAGRLLLASLSTRRARVLIILSSTVLLFYSLSMFSSSAENPPEIHSTSDFLSNAIARGKQAVAFGPFSLGKNTPSTPVSPISYSSNATVNSHPTPKFRDNLWSDKRYITTWPEGGMSNNVMEFFSLIHLGQLTDRTPVIPAFIRGQDLVDESEVYFGNMFDMERLQNELRMPIVEWRDVKTPGSQEMETMGCWSADWAAGPHYKPPSGEAQERELGLDVSYTKIWQMATSDKHDWHVRLQPLVVMGFPSGHASAVRENPTPSASRINQALLPPDEQMYCIDLIFYMGLIYSRDLFQTDYAPVWRSVGRHAHFAPPLVLEAKNMLRNVFKIDPQEEIPPFIAMHIRHGDFQTWCDKQVPVSECLSSPRAFAIRVQEIQDELRETRGLEVTHVLATSDESSLFWSQVSSEGYDWVHVDHNVENTRERLGKWTPPVMDAIFHSLAIGFVGTDRSTFSELSALRVKSWNGGVTRFVNWGRKGSDEH